jgi:hypothetical protein
MNPNKTKAAMDAIDSNINDDSHLQGLTPSEIEFIRKLTSITVESVLNAEKEKNTVNNLKQISNE